MAENSAALNKNSVKIQSKAKIEKHPNGKNSFYPMLALVMEE